MPTIWHQATISKIVPLTHNTRQFTLELETPLTFQPGQFITLDLPVSEKRLHRWKSYSIANASHDRQLELCIVEVPDGLASRYLFQEAREGTTLRFKGPEGGFVLPNLFPEQLILICTGTGIAPFRSMIKTMDQQGKFPPALHLIFGCRTPSDLLYSDDWIHLAKTIPGFQYSVAFSRAPELPLIPGLQAHHGYVHDIYRHQYHTPKSETLFMLCGWTSMVDQAVQHIITDLGFQKNQVRYELYG